MPLPKKQRTRARPSHQVNVRDECQLVGLTVVKLDLLEVGEVSLFPLAWFFFFCKRGHWHLLRRFSAFETVFVLFVRRARIQKEVHVIACGWPAIGFLRRASLSARVRSSDVLATFRGVVLHCKWWVSSALEGSGRRASCRCHPENRCLSVVVSNCHNVALVRLRHCQAVGLVAAARMTRPCASNGIHGIICTGRVTADQL